MKVLMENSLKTGEFSIARFDYLRVCGLAVPNSKGGHGTAASSELCEETPACSQVMLIMLTVIGNADGDW